MDTASPRIKARRVSLKKICEGYIYAGFDVNICKLPAVLRTVRPICLICEQQYADSWIVVDNKASHKWKFAYVHECCAEWSPCDKAACITRPHDPLTPHKGLTMICRASAMVNCAVYINQDDFDVSWFGCFICQKQLNHDVVTFAIASSFMCAQSHNKCIEPFIKERDRAYGAYKRLCIWKACILWPLGDCRIIIARLLLEQDVYKEIFDTMFAD